MTGINLAGTDFNSQNVYADSPAERYAKYAAVARSFSICQFGVSLWFDRGNSLVETATFNFQVAYIFQCLLCYYIIFRFELATFRSFASQSLQPPFPAHILCHLLSSSPPSPSSASSTSTRPPPLRLWT